MTGNNFAGAEAGRTRRQGRLRAWLQAALAIGVALFFLVAAKRPWLGACAAVLAAFLTVACFFQPWQEAFEKASRGLAHAVGIALDWLLLVPVYYLGFTLIGWLTRISNRDPLGLRLDPQKESYWIERGKSAPASQYQRQF